MPTSFYYFFYNIHFFPPIIFYQPHQELNVNSQRVKMTAEERLEKVNAGIERLEKQREEKQRAELVMEYALATKELKEFDEKRKKDRATLQRKVRDLKKFATPAPRKKKKKGVKNIRKVRTNSQHQRSYSPKQNDILTSLVVEQQRKNPNKQITIPPLVKKLENSGIISEFPGRTLNALTKQLYKIRNALKSQ